MKSQQSEMIRVEHLSKNFNNKNQQTQVLQDVSLSINKGEIISILGESGCGKSTLLNIIGGFEQPSEGRVYLDGTEVLKPNRKCIMLFQNYGLLPWRSCQKNVELGLEGLGLTRFERREKALYYLNLVVVIGLDLLNKSADFHSRHFAYLKACWRPPKSRCKITNEAILIFWII